MKILDGELQEDLYECPEKVKLNSKLEPCRTTPIATDDVAYISGKLQTEKIKLKKLNKTR